MTTYRSIVVGTDGSATADRAVEEAFAAARTHGASVHIVTAYKPLNEREIADLQRGLPPHQANEIDETHGVRLLIDRMEKVAADAGIPAEFYAREGPPARVIVDVAREVGADLIIVGNVGMTGVRRVLGSVPNDVAHHAPCSVLIVRTAR
jgi:nucleotide-binding universal stress UspA family protein